MPPAHRQGDIGSGHGCHFPESAATGGSPNVFVNGKPLMRVGDSYAAHGCSTCPEPPHGRALAIGSATVFVNGMQAGRIGDGIDCGGSASSGSPNVFIGDQCPTTEADAAAGGTECQAAQADQSSASARG
jgi:uncharacterized Zn-binding protein involved in type VI secretion